MNHTVRVWDLPTRFFHWCLALGILGMYITGKASAQMQWHFRIGYFIVALVLFRIVWGFVGGHWSRFGSFMYSPRQIVAYLQGQGTALMHVGHNPLGSFSVFALLLLMAAQLVSGLSSGDFIFFTGPLARFLPEPLINFAYKYHKGWGQYLLLAMVALHLIAIAFYTLAHRQGRLVRAMFTGDKQAPGAAPSSADTWKTRLLALVLFAACYGFTQWLQTLQG